MRNNKLLPINKILKINNHYPSYVKILIKLQIHVNLLIKIEKFIKQNISKKLYHIYNVQNLQNNILFIEIANSNYMLSFLKEKSNLICILQKFIIPSLKDIKFNINPIISINCFKKNKYINNNMLTKYSVTLLKKLSKKSPIKLRNIIIKFIASSK
ncbi:hypothetical protein [Enterobacteriaceae endosymbiont of Neohaemonia nigricornis]|uniref:hypothetical protein n=1 Tax=Enterobacteriaceae endosymbiont of Neohaemonia nigricornis TaxID=2675792 RepID=UPI001448E9C9|nr:hypothetical protein [Enterobacteriaceae endosymbiont of Neohaemonia nigricornis]QJC30346.1 hypothetical protein GJT85_00730 [Enterobacteriaceae endosymbiont of Neohaemonia nigricornis]